MARTSKITVYPGDTELIAEGRRAIWRYWAGSIALSGAAVVFVAVFRDGSMLMDFWSGWVSICALIVLAQAIRVHRSVNDYARFLTRHPTTRDSTWN